MNELASLYGRFLELGLNVTREAIRSRDLEWAEAEIEFLHNVPSLLEETNIARHRYFWFAERELYIQRLEALDRELPKSRMRTFYEPLWREMEPILEEMFASPEALSNANT